MCFVQAEDGIRDLVRSRGLGDVYKRQIQSGTARRRQDINIEAVGSGLVVVTCRGGRGFSGVWVFVGLGVVGSCVREWGVVGV